MVSSCDKINDINQNTSEQSTNSIENGINRGIINISDTNIKNINLKVALNTNKSIKISIAISGSAIHVLPEKFYFIKHTEEDRNFGRVVVKKLDIC